MTIRTIAANYCLLFACAYQLAMRVWRHDGASAGFVRLPRINSLPIAKDRAGGITSAFKTAFTLARVSMLLAVTLGTTLTWTADAQPFDDDLPNLLTEDFDDPSLTGWSLVSEAAKASTSDWEVVAGRLEHANPLCEPGTTLIDRPGSYARYDAGTDWADYTMETLVSSDSDGYVGIIFRWQDADNYYRFSWKRGQSLRLLTKKENGRFRILAQDNAAYLPETHYALGVDVSGGVIKVYVDDQLVFHVADPAPIPAGTVALYSCGTDVAGFDFVDVWDRSGAQSLNPPSGAASFADRVNALQPGEWARLNINRFDQVWPPLAQRPFQNTHYQFSNRVISAWSSMTWDANRGDLLFWGGGHANYAGNEVYRWRSSTLSWERGSLPSEVEQIDGSLYHAVDGPFAAPASAHTYDSNEFLPLSNRMIVFGGAAFNTGGPFQKFVDGRGVSTGPYLWDPAKSDSNKVGGTEGSQVDPLSYPDVEAGHMWENRDQSFRGGVNSVTAYAEENGKDVIYFQPQHGTFVEICDQRSCRSESR